jgi:hypothetical protein
MHEVDLPKRCPLSGQGSPQKCQEKRFAHLVKPSWKGLTRGSQWLNMAEL